MNGNDPVSFDDVRRAAAGRVPAAVTADDIARILGKETLDERDFRALLAPAAAVHLEAIAQRARELTLRNFGRTISLYAPLYVSNLCDNECVYCGFKHSTPILRRRLSLAEVEREAQIIAGTGIRHLLLLTGESRRAAPVAYIRQCVELLKRYFSSLAIEVYALERDEYAELVAAGVDGLTMFQETYDEALYARLHLNGPKRDYRFRLDAPERACRAGMRTVTLGALLGLTGFRDEVFLAGLHGAYLQCRYPGTEIAFAFPRIQPQTGNFEPGCPVSDRDLVQAILAVRCFLPRAGITISTREDRELRSNLVPLGVTQMSAGSRTDVGGYGGGTGGDGQFAVADTSSVAAVKAMIAARGYCPVMQDWRSI
jgi:2-iminoacetate synthase